MRKILLLLLLSSGSIAKAQQIDSIYVNLYTDSLKKGTFNYINIDGLLSTGKYLPLDSTALIFWASAGYFRGNSLWIDKNFPEEKISFKVTVRKNPALHREFVIYVKKRPDPQLKNADQFLREMEEKTKHRSN